MGRFTYSLAYVHLTVYHERVLTPQIASSTKLLGCCESLSDSMLYLIFTRLQCSSALIECVGFEANYKLWSLGTGHPKDSRGRYDTDGEQNWGWKNNIPCPSRDGDRISCSWLTSQP